MVREEQAAGHGANAQPSDPDQPITMFGIASLLLRHRRLVVRLGLAGAVLGAATALLSTPTFVSSATFIPQGSDAGTSGLAQVVQQFDLAVPTNGAEWGPPVYVQLLQSRALLEPLALDTVAVDKDGGRRVALMDLLGIDAPTQALRVHRTILELNKLIAAKELKDLGAVLVTVSTPWPAVSLVLADQLVRGVNQFNLETRKSQAGAERQFSETQAADAERSLRESEDLLKQFLQRNRSIADSPELAFERDRLQRDVALRQQLYTTLLQNREEAKIREVRDTPVLTLIEEPVLPVVAESRGFLLKTALGGVAGSLLAAVGALLLAAVHSARGRSGEEVAEFFELLAGAKVETAAMLAKLRLRARRRTET